MDEHGDGVVLRHRQTTIVDTRAMAWSPHFGREGGYTKVLSRDSAGQPVIYLSFIAEREAQGGPDADRVRHASVTEHLLAIAGQLTTREYSARDDRHGTAVDLTSGVYVRRAPGSWHGLDPYRECPVGFFALEWRTGPGTVPLEVAAANETERAREPSDPLDPPTRERRDGIVLDRGGTLIIDSDAAPWEPHFGMERGTSRPSTGV